MAGTITAGTLSDGTNSTSTTNCIQGSAKAWVNFNGTTSPGTIRAQYNVSSVTKNTTGDYTVNFSSALADASYSAIASSNGGSNGGAGGRLWGNDTTALTASSARLLYNYYPNTAADAPIFCFAAFR